MQHPIIEFGGAGPVLQLAPANGFPPATYTPILHPLTDRYRVVCLPPRAMWPGAGEPPEEPGSWESLADELLAGMRLHRLTDVIAVGHSFGGVASLLAAVRERPRFRALCLLDPTILPPAVMDRLRALKQRGWDASYPIARKARERRAVFRDADEAFLYWREKPLFADWPDTALRLYTESTLRPAKQGDRFELSWSPAWEAHYYESFYPGTWSDIERLDPALPVLAIGGEKSDTFFPEAAALLRAKLPHARVVTLPGYGHLFPQAAPEATRTIIEGWLGAW